MNGRRTVLYLQETHGTERGLGLRGGYNDKYLLRGGSVDSTFESSNIKGERDGGGGALGRIKGRRSGRR